MSGSPLLLMVGVQEALIQVVGKSFSGAKPVIVQNSEIFFEKLDGITDGAYSVILIGAEMADVTALELAQSLRMQTPATKMFFVSTSNKTLPPANLIKNGCDDVFFFPMDDKIFQKTLRRLVEIEGESKPLLHSVPIEDLAAGSNVDFGVSVFLPMNQKYVKILKAGDQVRETQLEKISTQEIGQVFVDDKDLAKFVKYTNEIQKVSGGPVSKYEAKQKFATSIRSICHELLAAPPTLNFDEGKKLLAQIQQIVAPYVSQIKNYNFKAEVLCGANDAEMDLYERSSKLSVLAALMAFKLGRGSVETLAMAGLFMDLGLAYLPLELQGKAFKNMNKEEKDLFMKHPLDSVKMLQERKIILPQDMLDGISQHHEQLDGRGFPKQLPSHKISPTAQILYLVDRIVDLTTLTPGQKHLKAPDLIEALNKEPGIARDLVNELQKHLV